MVSIMRRVYLTFGKWLRHGAFQLSGTTRSRVRSAMLLQTSLTLALESNRTSLYNYTPDKSIFTAYPWI